MPPAVSSLTHFDSAKCPQFEPNNDFTACHYYEYPQDIRECGYCKRLELYRCIAHDGIVPISNHSTGNFLTCHYLSYLTHYRGIEVQDAKKSPPLKCGTLWDAALGKYLGGEDRETKKPYDIPKLIERYEIEPKDVARVRGIFRAYKELGIEVEPGYSLQTPIDLKIPFDKVWGDGYPVEMRVTGFYDRTYPNSFVENKFSGKPEFYLDVFFIQSQIGTYFLADPTLEFCIMEVVRAPALRAVGKNKEEAPESHEERVYQDAISRPSHYFIGYNNKTHRYGKKYFRKEFDLDEVKRRYLNVIREMHEAHLFNGWYKNDRVCNAILPGIRCDMMPLCRYNVMSETMYQIRKKPVIF